MGLGGRGRGRSRGRSRGRMAVTENGIHGGNGRGIVYARRVSPREKGKGDGEVWMDTKEHANLEPNSLSPSLTQMSTRFFPCPLT